MDNIPSDGLFADQDQLASPAETVPIKPEINRPALPTVEHAETAFPHRPGTLVSALGGLQAGVVGVAWMFVCFFVGAYWTGGGLWSLPNLFSTLFYGENAYQNEFFRTTWAGIALIVAIYGGLGIAWGCLWKDRRRPMLTLYGALTGLAAYYVFNFVWAQVDPLISLYVPTREFQVAHIFWGAALARSPIYSSRIATAIAPKPFVGGANGDTGQEAADSVSGELIR